MAVKITEELLQDLGFVKSGNAWNYKFFDDRNYFAIMGGSDNWMFFYQDQSVYVIDLMQVIIAVATIARNKGIEEMQTKLHQALGLDRLVDMLADRVASDRE